MNLFIDNALMGGVSAARNPHLKANNPKVEGYDSEKLKRWLLLVDCNNQVKFKFSVVNKTYLYILVWLGHESISTHWRVSLG